MQSSRSFKNLFFKAALFSLSVVQYVFPQGKVVFLNGTSSAGKSSIVREMQSLSTEPYVVVGFDEMFRRDDYRITRDVAIEFLGQGKSLAAEEVSRIRTEKIDELVKRLEVEYPKGSERPWDWKPVSLKTFEALYEEVVRLAMSEKNVVIDSLISDDEVVKVTFEKLAGLDNIRFVCVYASPAILLEHVTQRNKSGIIEEEGDFSQALEQFAYIYKPHKLGDPIISGEPISRDMMIALLEHMREAECKGADAAEKFSKFRDAVLTSLSLKDEGSPPIRVASRFVYDCVVDTGSSSLRDCALQILANNRSRAFNVNCLRMGLRFEWDNWESLEGALDPLKSAFIQAEASFGEDTTEEEYVKFWKERCVSLRKFIEEKPDQAHFYIVRRGGDVVAFALFFSCIDPTGVYVDLLATHPSMQGCGLGTQLIFSIFDKLPDSKKITLGTNRRNVKTRAFYEKIGFRPYLKTDECVMYEYLRQ